MTTTQTISLGDTRTATGKLELLLRVAVACEFIGHGAFGAFTKDGWLPYYEVFGIGDGPAMPLMQLTGAVDIALGLLLLVRPMRGAVLWMSFWGLMTAFLRPAAGQGMWEVVERSYNYGVPLTLLLLYGLGTSSERLSFAHWTAQVRSIPRVTAARADRLRTGMRAIIGAFLVGHGALGVVYDKGLLVEGYESVGLDNLVDDPSTLNTVIGWFEIVLGLAVFAVPATGLVLFVLLWKLATEGLYLTMEAYGAGFEVLERTGAYAAPLALVLLSSITRNRTGGDRTSSGGNEPRNAEKEASVNGSPAPLADAP